jgi:hypothetical protein
METPYDWLTVAIFAGLIVIFLQRSVGDEEPTDSIWSYLPPSVGCAVANYFGNNKDEMFTNGENHFIAIAIIAAIIAYAYYVIKPFGSSSE